MRLPWVGLCCTSAPYLQPAAPPPGLISAPAFINNIGVLKRSKIPTSIPRDFKKPDWELLFHAAATALSDYALSISVTHVKSHQGDSGTPFKDISLSAQLNIQADHATTYASYHYTQIPTPTRPYHQQT